MRLPVPPPAPGPQRSKPAAREKLGDGRVHVWNRLRWEPACMPRPDMLERVDVLGDYPPLTPQRYADNLGGPTPDQKDGPYGKRKRGRR